MFIFILDNMFKKFGCEKYIFWNYLIQLSTYNMGIKGSGF